jgi:hypothetical protein
VLFEWWIRNIREVFCTHVQCLIMSSTNDGSYLVSCSIYQLKSVSAPHDIQIGIKYRPALQQPVNCFPLISYRTERSERESDGLCSSCVGFKIAQSLPSFRSGCFNVVMFEQRKTLWKYKVNVLHLQQFECTYVSRSIFNLYSLICGSVYRPNWAKKIPKGEMQDEVQHFSENKLEQFARNGDASYM